MLQLLVLLNKPAGMEDTAVLCVSIIVMAMKQLMVIWSGLAVSAGQHVAKGDIIGFAGSSGYSTGPHVHYEVMADGQYVDPHYVLK